MVREVGPSRKRAEPELGFTAENAESAEVRCHPTNPISAVSAISGVNKPLVAAARPRRVSVVQYPLTLRAGDQPSLRCCISEGTLRAQSAYMRLILAGGVACSCVW